MLFGKTKLELKVGIFVFFGLVVLALFVLSISDIRGVSSGYKLKFSFNFINGVKVGAPVRYAGVDIGEVKAISFVSYSQDETKVEVLALLRKNVRIPVDSTVWINTLGLLGEKYIEIMPGKSRNYFPANDISSGNDPTPMHEMVSSVKKTADDVGVIVSKTKNGEGTLGKFLTDDTIYSEMEALVLDLKKHPWKLFWKTK